MSAPGLDFEGVPDLSKIEKQRINSGKFYRICFSIHLPKWMVLGMWTALPEDAMLCASAYEVQRNVHTLVIWSDKFPVTPESQQIPELTVIANTETKKVEINLYNPTTQHFEVQSWQ